MRTSCERLAGLDHTKSDITYLSVLNITFHALIASWSRLPDLSLFPRSIHPLAHSSDLSSTFAIRKAASLSIFSSQWAQRRMIRSMTICGGRP